MILHIPHASNCIPEKERAGILLNDEELTMELLAITDWFTDDLFCTADVATKRIIYPVSRLIIDPERFVEDASEPMAARGRGLIYTRNCKGEPLRNLPTQEERDRLLEKYYWPHHSSLSSAVRQDLDASDSSLIVDCHSFPERPLPFEIDQEMHRADICIGTDSYHTPNWLHDELVELFLKKHYTVAVNRPFEGSLVPSEYYEREQRVSSVMIELNRRLYMDEVSGQKSDGYEQIKQDLRDILSVIDERC